MSKLLVETVSGMSGPPRLSFSDDVVALGSHQQLRRVPSAVTDDDEYSSAEFDFGASIFEAAASSSADELFSGGKILPAPAFPFKNTTNPAPPQPAVKQVLVEENNRTSEKKDDYKVSAGSNVDSGGNITCGGGRWAFWSRIRRSGSVNGDYAAGGDGAGRRYISSMSSLSGSPSMRRSKSTGYYDAPPHQKHFPATKPHHHRRNTFESAPGGRNQSGAKTCYYSGLECRSFSGYRNTGGAVRIVPVLNVRPINFFGSWRSGGGSSGRSTGGAMIDDGGGATTSSSSSYCSFYDSNSLFDYLLCKCSSKGSIKTMEVV